MSKYSHKLRYFIHTNNHLNIIPISNTESAIYKSIFINNIIDIIINLNSNNVKYNLLETSSLGIVHKSNEYPLMYYFFRSLHKSNKSQQLNINITDDDLSNYESFQNWYSINIQNINISNIIQQLESIDKSIDNELSNIYDVIFKTNGIRSILHNNLYKNTFIGLDIQQYIESSEINYYDYSFNNNNIKIFVPKNLDNNIDGPNISIICMIIDLMISLAKKYNLYHNQNVNLCLIYAPNKKTISKNNTIITGSNINSGSTYPGMSITCWRKEELYKVLIHELVHYFEFDFHSKSFNEYKLNIPDVNGNDSINESFTESLALIINLLFIIFKNNKNKLDRKIVCNTFMKMLNDELLYSLFQIGKVISIMGGQNYDDYEKGKITINQNTSFRSYFIIKTFILLNLGSYIKFIDKSPIVNNDTRINEYVNLINESVKYFDQNKYKIIIDKYIDHYNTNRSNKWIYKTGRMTCYD